MIRQPTRPGGWLSPSDLGSLVRATAAAAEDWLAVVRFTADRRWFHRLTLAAEYEIWLLSWLPGGKQPRIYSINLMWALHPAWFREDLERLFGLLETRAIQPRIAERISFDKVAEAHRRLEAGGLDGKLVLYPDLASVQASAAAA